jgi:GTP cyclohydrolase I
MSIEKAVKDILTSIGEDPNREGLLDTPDRVTRMYKELFAGYSQDPKSILARTFSAEGHQEMVIVRDIQFYSHCEHHMVPFFGKVHIGYIPNGSVVGLSKLARLVECFARRLQIQERMTTQIAEAIQQYLSPLGVMVVVEAEHMCMKMRGVKNPCADTVTSAVRGIFRDPTETARTEFLTLIRK